MKKPHRTGIVTILLTVISTLVPVTFSLAEPVEDPYLWLEEVESVKALDWVNERNRASLGYLTALPSYSQLRQRNLDIYDSDERIAYPSQLGTRVYNFWRDASNPRGIWRRVDREQFIESHGDPVWETVLDVDALAKAEDENWVWKGVECLPDTYDRCLISLSRGGADATVIREYDTASKAFVKNGFELPEAKSDVNWIDRDTVFVETDFGPESLTDSGYPRIVKRWTRGTPLADAKQIFAGDSGDVWNGAYRVRDGDRRYDLVRQVPTFFTSRLYLLNEKDKLKRIEIPEDATLHTIVNGQMLIELKTAWQPGKGVRYPQGGLLAIDFSKFMKGDRKFQRVVEPTASSAIDAVARTGDSVLVNRLDNVSNKLERFEFANGKWTGAPVETPPLGSINITSTHADSADYFFTYEDFLTPDTLYAAPPGEIPRALKALPAYFDTEGMKVVQHFAVSGDGTRVPYFLITPAGFKRNGTAPTLLYGYGGFEVSLKPSYSATVGHSWLARGGSYVVANIRGGGEYGPAWHQAALKENRQVAFDDFAAVAADLSRRRITSPEHLGIRGGSNGGLLMGVMLTQRPELFDAVVVQVPLLDMRRFNKLLAGASWMDEYGNPDTSDWDYISEYSPYQNVQKAKKYPSTFFTTSTRDDRVHPGHARKMVAKMADYGHKPLYYENTVGGHAGASDNKQQAHVQALIYSYLWDRLGD